MERTEATGLLRATITGGGPAPGALASAGRGAGAVRLLARRTPRGLALALRGADGDEPFGAPVPAGERAAIELSFEPSLYGQQLAVARVDGRDAAQLSVPKLPTGGLRVGGAPRFAGTVTLLPALAPVCRRLTR